MDGSKVIVSPAFHPLAIGDKGDVHPSPEQISAIVSMLIDAGICCFFVQEYALIYYGTRRQANDRILCIPDEQHDLAVERFSQNDILKPCGPLPLERPGFLNHKYPRFKAVGRTDFWLLLPASYCHMVCEPSNVEWSRSDLPYPKLPVYVQSLMDTKRGVDLEDLVDGMDLSEDRGEQHLNLEGYTDTQWLESYYKAFQEDGHGTKFIYIDPTPVARRDIWQRVVQNKQRRMGWKYPPEKYATRFKRHGSKDPRIRHIPGL